MCPTCRSKPVCNQFRRHPQDRRHDLIVFLFKSRILPLRVDTEKYFVGQAAVASSFRRMFPPIEHAYILQRTCGSGVELSIVESVWKKYQGVFLIIIRCFQKDCVQKTATYKFIRAPSTPFRGEARFSTFRGGHKQLASPAPSHTDSGSQSTR